MLLMKERLNYGQPWALPDVYLFTGNPVKRRDGAIVMGRGAARQVRDAYPGVDRRFGALMEPGRRLVWLELAPRQHLGWLQVKHHWRDAADLELIRDSLSRLAALCRARPRVTFHLNAPGCGNGGLDWERDIEPLCEELLPDNAVVYL